MKNYIIEFDNTYMCYNSFPGIKNVIYYYEGYEIRMC